MASKNKAVLKAVLYADIFEFPLTREELYYFAVGARLNSQSEAVKAVGELKDIVSTTGEYVHIKGNEKFVEIRQRRKKSSQKKLLLAKTLTVYLSFIPSVLFVGVTGGVAAENAEKDDDIDFIIITSNGALWPTRLVLLLILHVLGRRRVKDASFVADLACLNFFIDESAIEFPETMQNLYTAHEFVQMKPLFSRGDMYGKFISKNTWISSFLPQSGVLLSRYEYVSKPFASSVFQRFLSTNAVVQLSRFLQLLYMGRRKRESYISEYMLGFFPQDFHSRVMALFEEKLRKYERIK
ncbi:MAG: hypothetical protein RLZZ455_505 [Candidatus Parcubacteria bacterium]|jgi:hypothetical protein